jgi:hypothetical protein
MKFTLTKYGTLTLSDKMRKVSLSKQEVAELRAYLYQNDPDVEEVESLVDTPTPSIVEQQLEYNFGPGKEKE